MEDLLDEFELTPQQWRTLADLCVSIASVSFGLAVIPSLVLSQQTSIATFGAGMVLGLTFSIISLVVSKEA